MHLWLVHPDGSDLRQLTFGPRADTHPTWSPDGKSVAFARDGDLWTIGASGHNATPVLVNGEHAVREPAWSPDGALIAFHHSLYTDQIWTVHPDGSHAGPLTALGEGEAQSAPAWQANGTLAYVSRRANVVALYTVNPDGSDQQPLISQRPAQLFAPTAARDGSVFGFASTLTGRHNIWVSRDFRITPFDTSAEAFDAAAGRTVTLVYGTTSVATVTVTLVDGQGRTVRTFARAQRMPTGTRSIVWDGRDSQGRRLPEGGYTFELVAQAPGLPPLQRGAGVVIDDISLHGALAVRVIERGRPVRAAEVTVSLARTDSYVDGRATDRSGAVAFDLAPGRYDLSAIAGDGAQGALQGVQVATGGRGSATIDVGAALATGTPRATPTGVAAMATPTPAAKGAVTGTLRILVETAPGKPADGAEIQVYAGGTYLTANFTDSSGVISFTLRPGTYTLKVSLGDASTTVGGVVVAANAVTTQRVGIGSGTLQVLVQVAPGQPANGAQVQVSAGGTLQGSSFTDSSGVVTFTLNSGSYTIQTTLGDAVGAVVPVQVLAGAVTQKTIVLHAGTLAVTVLDRAGRHVDGARVDVEAGGLAVATNYTDSSGTVSFTLNAGSYEVTVSQGNTTNSPAPVHVAEGRTTSYTATLGAGSSGQQIGGNTWDANATAYATQIGSRYSYVCPPGGSASAVWGTDTYTDDSSVCTAAVHRGLITFAKGGTVTIQMAPGLSSYKGTTRNGVTTANWGAWEASFIFPASGR
jgi:hypothetical protein